MDYKKAGVDIEAGYKSVELMKEHVKKTIREEVLGGLGGFSGSSWTSMIPSASTLLPCVSMILPAQAVSHYSS